MRETRKLAAILVSDVVGYSRCAGGADWEHACNGFSRVPCSFLKGLYP
jgi:hypothetical protein